MVRKYLAWAVLLFVPMLLNGQPSNNARMIVNDSIRTVLRGNTHPFVRPEFDRGPARPDLPMQRMLLVLKRSPEQQRDLDQYLASVQNRQSVLYHQWLTPTEFGSRFGVSPQDVEVVNAWLQSHGLTPVRLNNARTILEFSGSAAQVEEAFHTQLRSYRVSGRDFYANSSDPEIPSGLASVVAGVATMHNFVSRGSVAVAKTGTGLRRVGTKPAFTFSDQTGDLKHALVPDDLQTIYNAKPLLETQAPISGRGQKIAIAARSNINPYDFRAFRALFQPFAPLDALRIVVNGADPGITNDEDMIEATADAEYAGALAPDAGVVLVVSASTNNSDGVALSALYAVDNNIAPILSLSYGACEAVMGTAYNQFYASLWEQAAAQGISVIVASGDSGPAGCEVPSASGVASQGPAVNGLASTPFNIAVGGTQFDANTTNWSPELNVAFGSALAYMTETAWNESCSPGVCGMNQSKLSAGAGGPSNCSVLSSTTAGKTSCIGHYPKPAWQSGPGVPNDSARDLPDLALASASSTGYVICLLGSCSIDAASGKFQFYVVGGTSLAAPSFAGAMALVNQQLGSSQGQAAPELYAIAQAEATDRQCILNMSTCAFQDVTSGNTDVPCAGGSPGCSSPLSGTYGVLKGYAAAAGYDMATGLGSINVANLVTKWGVRPRPQTATTIKVSPSSSVHGQPTKLTIEVASIAGEGIPSGDIVVQTESSTPNSATMLTGTLSNGTFTGELASLPGGTYDLSARYAGNDDFAPSTSSPVRVTVAPEPSMTELKAFVQSPSELIPAGTSISYGSRILLNAHAVGVSKKGVATGTVTFHVNAPGAPIGLYTKPLNNTAEVETGFIAKIVGIHLLTSEYSGDSSLQPSTSPALALDVVKATTSLTAALVSQSVPSNGIVQVKVELQTTSYSQVLPSGTVAATVGSSKLGSARVQGYTHPDTGLAYASAELNIPARELSLGPNQIAISYDGDALYQSASSSWPLVANIFAPASAPGTPVQVKLSATPDTVTANDIVTLKAIVTADAPPVGGKVKFFDGSRQLAAIQVVGSNPAPGYEASSATLKTRLPLGTNNITARFEAEGTTYQPASSQTVAVNVSGNAPTRTMLSASGSIVNPANYDLTISVLGAGPVPPSGSVALLDVKSGTEMTEIPLEQNEPNFALVDATSSTVDKQPFADAVAVTTADLNNDGNVDVITANKDDRSVSVFLGKADRTFSAPLQFPIQASPVQIMSIDVNQDGYPDLLASTATGTVSVLLGRGDGTFDPEKSFSVADGTLRTAEGDFNGDGRLDLAVYSEQSPWVFILIGAGDGTFRAPQAYLSGEAITGLVVDDFNHDGTSDVITSGASGLWLLTGVGDGTLRLADVRPYEGTSSYFTSQLSSLVTSDFNHDGIPDIAAIPTMLPFETLVFLGNPDGTLQPPQTLAPNGLTYLDTSVDAVSVAVTDVNGDGNLDVVQMLAGASGDQTLGAIYVYLGTADGGFGNPLFLSIPAWQSSAPNSFALADIDGDGIPDVLTTTHASPAAGLITARMQPMVRATLPNLTPSPSRVIQATYAPDGSTPHWPSSSNILSLGALAPTTVTLQYGYKTTQGNCYLGGASSIYWNSVPCFYLHVSSESDTPLSGTVLLNGTTPGGQAFHAGPYNLYSDGNNGGYVYVFYNYGLGDAGAYSFTLSYLGDDKHQASTSTAPVVIHLQSLPTKVTLTGPTVVLSGENVSISGKLESPLLPGTPLSGSVALYDGDVLLQENSTYLNDFSFVVPLSQPGTHQLSAHFGGQIGQYGTLNASQSTSSTLTVSALDRNPRPSGTVQLDISPKQLSVGLPATFDISVTGYAQPVHGSITLFDRAIPLATLPLTPTVSTGASSAHLKMPLAVGSHTLTARFNGYASVTSNTATTLLPSTSTKQSITVVSPAPSETAVSANDIGGGSYEISGQAFVYGTISAAGRLSIHDQTTGTTVLESVLDPVSATPSFHAGTTIPVNGRPDSLLAVDINSDGLPDLIVPDRISSTLHVFRSTTANEYGSQEDYALTGVPQAISFADVNRDGTPDILVATTNRHLDLFLANSDGSLSALVMTTLPFAASALQTADMNGDGCVDLVLLGDGKSLAMLLGNADGTFASPTIYNVPRFSTGFSVAVADLNGDGVQDVLLVTNNDGTYELLGVGDGTLQSPIYVSALNGNVIARDLNNDGIPDLIYAPGAGKIAVQLGRGDGSFTPLRYYSAVTDTSEQNTLTTADLNSDGVLDVITSGMVLLGHGDGTFTPVSVPTAGAFSWVADVNADGVPDLLRIEDQSISVQYGGTAVPISIRGVQVRGSGIHEITATFVPAPSAPYSSSTSAPLHLQAFQTAPVRLSLSVASPATGVPTYGESPSIQVDVTPVSGTTMPTGQIVVQVDGNPVSSATLMSGRTQVNLPMLAGGMHVASVEYEGDSNFSPDTESLSITVRPATSTLNLTSSASSVTGSNVTVTAMAQGVSGGLRPSGTVIFEEGSNTLAQIALVSGIASLTTNTLSPGLHHVRATYSGDPNYAATTATTDLTIVAPDVDAVISPAVLNVQRYQPASAVVRVSAKGGFTGTVTLTCGTLTSVNCAFQPSVILLDPAIQSATANLSINVAATPLTRVRRPLLLSPNLDYLSIIFVGLSGLVFVFAKPGKRTSLSLWIVLAAILSLCFMSCGGNTSNIAQSRDSQTQTTNIDIPITVSAGHLSHEVHITVVVQ